MNTPDPTPIMPDEIRPLRCARSGNSGQSHVYLADKLAGEARELRCPILIAEGFPGGHSQDYLLGILNLHGLMSELRRRDYDVIVIGFNQGSDRIQKNAGVIEDCIEQCKARTQEPLVLAGMSMGGLVVRYALTRMEHEQRDHRTRAFFTLDTPHRGSHTSLAVQWFVHNFREMHPVLAEQARLLNSPANQQFSRLRLHQNKVVESPLRSEFFDELRRLGNYPQKPQRWALASGAADGVRVLRAHQEIFDWDGGPRFSARLWTLGSGGAEQAIAQGRCDDAPCLPLRYASDLSWEALPGGQGDHFERMAQIAGLISGGPVESRVTRYCTIPTFSALDLDPEPDPFEPIPPSPAGLRSAFHDWICADQNLPHLHFTEPMRDWLLRKLESFDSHDRASNKGLSRSS